MNELHAPAPAGFGTACRQVARQPLYWLLVAMPAALAMEYSDVGGLWVFVVSALAIVPLAGLMGRATENLAETLGAGIGGLLNATFGNAAELIIALIALSKASGMEDPTPMFDLVKASITGSIIGNILLVLGLSILLGGLKHRRQTFNRTAAGMGATLLALAAVGLIFPTLYAELFAKQGGKTSEDLVSLSEEIAVILAVIYLLSLVFSLKTHSHLFSGHESELAGSGDHGGPEWSRRTSVAMLVAATAGVAWMSELLVGSVEHAAERLGMNNVFVGVIVVAVIGNAAEHSTAVLMAMKNKMDLAVHVAVGSGIQIALFVAPVLVFASLAMGHDPPLDLHFTLPETISVMLAVGILSMVSQDGESHWMEGVMLLGVYVIMALAFYHLPT
ncbi:MAG: calcium/proton exchanger [Candidatus Nealsonbacteria bacterium]|nr:calcium/proton exchanger [Candidatus Nealsonbacteria bacterium]